MVPCSVPREAGRSKVKGGGDKPSPGRRRANVPASPGPVSLSVPLPLCRSSRWRGPERREARPNSDGGNVIQGPLHLTPASPVALPQPHPCPVFPPRWCWSCCCIEAFQPGAAEDQPPEGGDPRPGPAPRAQQMTERSGVSIWLGWQVWRCKGQRAEVLRWPVSRHRKCGYISQVQFRPRIGCL